MPKPKDSEATDFEQAWSIEGVFQHLIYSPKGGIEGLLIETDGALTQFVVDQHDGAIAGDLAQLAQGQTLVVEGVEMPPSPKGAAQHVVYRFQRLASVEGREVSEAAEPADVSGKVARFNYAKHGEPNGYVLENGDFVHTRPDGFKTLGLNVGDTLKATGPLRALVDHKGRVVEAQTVNGTGIGR